MCKPLPKLDECRALITRMIEQTVRDYLSLAGSTDPQEQMWFESSECFLFEDEYRVMWGDEEKSLEDFLNILGIDIDWFRQKVLVEKKKRDLDELERKILDTQYSPEDKLKYVITENNITIVFKEHSIAFDTSEPIARELKKILEDEDYGSLLNLLENYKHTNREMKESIRRFRRILE